MYMRSEVGTMASGLPNGGTMIFYDSLPSRRQSVFSGNPQNPNLVGTWKNQQILLFSLGFSSDLTLNRRISG